VSVCVLCEGESGVGSWAVGQLRWCVELCVCVLFGLVAIVGCLVHSQSSGGISV
jgi:hypothetical protein